jgi:hypothetical protein
MNICKIEEVFEKQFTIEYLGLTIHPESSYIAIHIDRHLPELSNINERNIWRE